MREPAESSTAARVPATAAAAAVPSTSALLGDRLRAGIVAGYYVGVLPAERIFAGTLGVPLARLRGALGMLATEGWLQREGAFWLIPAGAEPSSVSRSRSETGSASARPPGLRVTGGAKGTRNDRQKFALRAAAAMTCLIANPPTIAVLAERFDVSKCTLQRSIEETFGEGAAAYFLRLRIEAAKPMLARGDTVSCVARAVGFHFERAFACAFVRLTGMRPGQYAGRVRLCRSSRIVKGRADCGVFF